MLPKPPAELLPHAEGVREALHRLRRPAVLPLPLATLGAKRGQSGCSVVGLVLWLALARRVGIRLRAGLLICGILLPQLQHTRTYLRPHDATVASPEKHRTAYFSWGHSNAAAVSERQGWAYGGQMLGAAKS